MGAIAFSGRASHDRRTDDSLEEESEELFPSANGSSLSPTEGGRRNESSAVSTFWLTLLLLIGLGLAIGFVVGVLNGDLGVLFIGVVLILLFFPLIQLLAIGIACLIVTLGRSERTDLGGELYQLGKIALGTILGSGAGFAVLVLLFK